MLIDVDLRYTMHVPNYSALVGVGDVTLWSEAGMNARVLVVDLRLFIPSSHDPCS